MPSNRTCPNCGSAFAKPTKYCTAACYHQASRGTPRPRRGGRPTRCCIGCGAEFTVPPSRLKYGAATWCSQACRYSTPGWADALKPSGRKVATCGTCGVEFRAVTSAPAHYCSMACLGIANGKRQQRDPSKWTTKACIECGASFEAKLCLGDRKKFCSRSCLGLWTCRNRRIARPTSIELALEAALAQVGVATIRELRAGRFNIDLAIPDARIAIEADGTYWHALPKQIAADARKNVALAEQGWLVLRFGEDQINSDIASCVATVIEALEARQ